MFQGDSLDMISMPILFEVVSILAAFGPPAINSVSGAKVLLYGTHGVVRFRLVHR